MPFDLWLWHRRIKEVEREFLAVQFSTEEMLRIVRLDSYVLVGGMDVTDLVRAVNHLEGTYIVRMFSEFETGLRMHWEHIRGKDSPSRTRDLVDGSAAYNGVSLATKAEAHAVRDYRNYLVHQRDGAFVPIRLIETRSTLCTFLSFLKHR